MYLKGLSGSQLGVHPPPSMDIEQLRRFSVGQALRPGGSLFWREALIVHRERADWGESVCEEALGPISI